MANLTPSALITDRGRRVSFRLGGRLFEVEQADLRTLLGIPEGPPGLGITIEGERFHFEFAADNREVKITATQLRRRLAKLTSAMRPAEKGPGVD